MKECVFQYKQNLIPQSEEDLELLASEFKFNQLVRAKVYKINPLVEPSVVQNNLLHACFKLVADNSDDPNMNTKAKVKFACKVALDFRYQDRVAVRPDGTVVFEYRSFKFSDLQDMERLKIFERSFDWLAEVAGVDKETMITEAQSLMHRRA